MINKDYKTIKSAIILRSRLLKKVTGQTLCLLVPVAQARKVINRKRFLEEYERTVNNFTGRLDAE